MVAHAREQAGWQQVAAWCAAIAAHDTDARKAAPQPSARWPAAPRTCIGLPLCDVERHLPQELKSVAGNARRKGGQLHSQQRGRGRGRGPCRCRCCAAACRLRRCQQGRQQVLLHNVDVWVVEQPVCAEENDAEHRPMRLTAFIWMQTKNRPINSQQCASMRSMRTHAVATRLGCAASGSSAAA